MNNPNNNNNPLLNAHQITIREFKEGINSIHKTTVNAIINNLLPPVPPVFGSRTSTFSLFTTPSFGVPSFGVPSFGAPSFGIGNKFYYFI
ncbi:hypothetical protein RhiirA1_487046 [Rhizophagus irregularis]|uniref:Uncharacterized protein n=1 Tax=Rhizophagus irregularis TaxID=588596 RepID=A0A2N0QGP3_9GLOM|nr:hypothetical protein RhiirA1_487046 [Rhizophagus irregularis]